ncbi:DUF4190 domain-containing protein [Candidatus Omnitrophota bacterium]
MEENQDSQEAKGKLSEFAIASLVIGIASLISLAGLEKAIIAIIFGALALKKMEKNEQLSGRNLATAGIVVALFSIVITATFIIKFLPKLKEQVKQLQSQEADRPGNAAGTGLKTEPSPQSKLY